MSETGTGERLADWEPSNEPTGDWWEVLRYARGHCPVSHSDGGGDGFWLASTQECVRQVLQQPEYFSSAEGITIPHHPASIPMPPIDVDPPLQSSFRRLLNPFLSPNALKDHEPVVRGFARDLINKFVDRGSCEFMGEFARPLPMMVLGHVIFGMDSTETLERFQTRDRGMGAGGEDEGAMWVFLRDLCTEVVHERAKRPDNSIISAIVHGSVEDRPVSEMEQIGTLMILVLGGLGTTTDAFGNIVNRLTQDPSLEERLRQPNWIYTELDEFLRLEPPVQWVGRTVTREVQLGGHTLQPGEKVMAHLASANRDEAVFEAGEELRFDRPENRHLAFGLGPHRCIGSNVARFELRIGFDELLSRVTRPRLSRRAIVERGTGMANGPQALPIEFDLVSG